MQKSNCCGGRILEGGQCEVCGDGTMMACPSCEERGRTGTLAPMTDVEMAKAGIWTPKTVLGCDECKHMEDTEGYRVYPDINLLPDKADLMIYTHKKDGEIKRVHVDMRFDFLASGEQEMVEEMRQVFEKYKFNK